MTVSQGSDHGPGAPDAPAPMHGGNEYPLLDIPFSVMIEGRRYAGEGLSMVGAEVTGLVDPALDGSTGIARLLFDFPGYQLALTPSVLIRVVDSNRMELAFTEPTGEHAPQLRQVLGDYISGDITASGSVIRAGAFAETRGVKAPAPKPTFGQRLRGGVGSVPVIGATIALVATAVGLAQSKLLTTAIPAPGRVIPDGQTMRATADGQITYVDLEAPEGEVLYSIDSVDGETLSIAMPCDCNAYGTGVAEGSTVLAGEPVVAVAPQDAQMVVEAQLPQELLFRIQRAGGVGVELSGGGEFEARLDESFRPPGIEAADEPERAILRPEIELEPEAMGQVAALTVRWDALAGFEPVIDAFDRIGAEVSRQYTQNIRPLLADISETVGDQ
ncbi:hypothetical protein [Salipiger mucosus]|uniref:Uncharacterized protein n=1 Tax=Salipiger mucosus DSM 16094 TaxID=1123237 RepID=S9SI38_9RHOB|nr:hypothetical protein [Salipiger mucosus]EPX85999.1 hypothetical protein Salmuc_00815 [Salipiger mucosus DSM 16094]